MFTVDDFDFFVQTEEFEGEVILFSNPGWMGPKTPETEAARIQGLKDAWVNADARRLEHSERLKALRPTMNVVRPHLNGMSAEHKANLSKAQMGNQNARKKPK